MNQEGKIVGVNNTSITIITANVISIVHEQENFNNIRFLDS